ncbi:MAG: TetR family transcriptional regulator [Desulfomonilaceae bacterium]
MLDIISSVRYSTAESLTTISIQLAPSHSPKKVKVMTDSSNKRDQLLQAATDLFATKGFRGTSIRDIANITSTSLSNIYHYFGSKEGLVLAILERFSREIVTELKRISELDLDPLERFELLVATHIRLAGNSMKESKIFFLDEEHLSPEGQKVNLKIQRDILGAYRRVLGAMNEANLVHSRKLTLTAFNILGVVNWLLRWYRPDGSLSLEEVSQEMVSFVLNGVLVSDIKTPDLSVGS